MNDDRRDVKWTFDRIASHFSQTREYPWPEVESFVESVDGSGTGAEEGVEGSAGVEGPALDVGCGNGRHLDVLARSGRRAIGLDVSRQLLYEARERAAERRTGASTTLVQGDATAMPIASDVAGLAVYVATIHHLPSRDLRIASLDELARVLAPGGRALVSAWSTEHDRFDAEEGFDTTIDWTLPDGETVERFYHVYAPDEFRSDLEASDLVVESTRVSSGNCYAEVSGP